MEVSCGVFEYPMHNFDVARYRALEPESPHTERGTTTRTMYVTPLRAGDGDSCVRMRSNLGLESHHHDLLHGNTNQKEEESTLVTSLDAGQSDGRPHGPMNI
jgi:hypothetical protein